MAQRWRKCVDGQYERLLPGAFHQVARPLGTGATWEAKVSWGGKDIVYAVGHSRLVAVHRMWKKFKQLRAAINQVEVSRNA